MADKDTTMLVESILGYMDWIKIMEAHRGRPSSLRYSQTLMDFIVFIIRKNIAYKDVFTLDTINAFKAYSGYKSADRAIKALSEYLYDQEKIDRPLQIPRPQIPLPDLYEDYLVFLQNIRQVSPGHFRHVAPHAGAWIDT